MKNLLYLSAVLVLLSFAACKKKTADAGLLTGTWQEREMVTQFSGTNYRIVFSGDNRFRMQEHRFTDIVVPGDSCLSSHTNYMRGGYSLSGNKLLLDGEYCNSTYAAPAANCGGVGSFRAQYRFVLLGNNLILNSNSDGADRIELERQ